MNGYDRTLRLRRTLKRRQLVSRALLYAAVPLYVSGFMAAITLPPLAIPLLVAAFAANILGITE